ncbi:MAG: hypothetical protein ABEJ61_09270 [Haloferacaceae archaeon]
MATASRVPEPRVLAGAKRRLFPDGETEAYAVTDTQFATDEWLPGEPVGSAVREALAPFNHVRLGGGYPDLVGVRRLESDLLATDATAPEPPLVAVEAKGHTDDGTVDVRRGVVQAHDRLSAANAAYLAAPAWAVTAGDRALARELNVGVLGVDADGGVDVVEAPRAVGNAASRAGSAVRFQASARGVADQSFGLNHPKNYLAYPLAWHADGPTDDRLVEHDVVAATDDARRGAAFLGLVDERPDGVALTSLGREVVRFALARYGSAAAALEEFAAWHGRSKRFVDLAPAWGRLARRVVAAYPATELLVGELQAMHDDRVDEPTLPDLVEYLHAHAPSFAVELFVRGTAAARGRVLGPDGDLRTGALRDGDVYHAPTVFQFKALLYHVGLLTERGSEPSRLDPTSDVWALRHPV